MLNEFSPSHPVSVPVWSGWGWSKVRITRDLGQRSPPRSSSAYVLGTSSIRLWRSGRFLSCWTTSASGEPSTMRC